MTTPPPTSEQIAPAGTDDLMTPPGLPDWLPDEATMNRLAGEFFAGLPGTSASTPAAMTAAVQTAPGPAPAPVPAAQPDGIEHAPRVDVPARSTDVPAVPGDSGGSTAVTPQPPPVAPDLPDLVIDDPAGAGLAPARSMPDVGAAITAVLGAAGLGMTVPDEPIIPGVTGIQLASPGLVTPAGPFGADRLQVPGAGTEQVPPLPGLATPLPVTGAPGAAASEQIIAGAGLPPGELPAATAVSSPLPGAHLVTPTSHLWPTTAPSPPDAAPFTPAAGLQVPWVPLVPTLPTASSGAIPSTWPTPPDSPTAESSEVGIEAEPGLPSIPQPPVPLPDPPAPVPTPSTPYYFLAESSPYRSQVERDFGRDGDLGSPAVAALDQLAAHEIAMDPPGPDPTGPDPTGPDPTGPDRTGPDRTGLHPTALDPAQAGAPSLNLSAPPVPSTTDLPAAPSAGAAPAAVSSSTFYFADRLGPALGGTGAAQRAATQQPTADPHLPFDVRLVRRDFPILAERVNGHQLVWFDNAATTQKPQAVIDRLAHFYRHENSNIHRAAHELAARATDAYEGARKTVARFVGAESEKNIVFVRGATEAINLVAKSWGAAHIRQGDEIIVSHLEHHANIVPWQQLIARTGAKLRVIPVDDTGQLLLQEYSRLLSERTKLVAVTHVSNALGTVTPVAPIVEMAHRVGACVLIDGAQSVPHVRVDMQTLGADFFVFSGHKIYGPTGIGALYGRTEVLESMPPWEGGGNMIADVTFDKTVFQAPPSRFEAGTGNIADAVGLGAALDYVTRLGLDAIARYEHHLLEYATPRMLAVRGLRLVGTARDKASVLSFVLDGYRTEEVGAALNQRGIAVRSGHHCAQPILRRFGLEATVRPSVAFYNTTDEIDAMVAVLHELAAGR